MTVIQLSPSQASEPVGVSLSRRSSRNGVSAPQMPWETDEVGTTPKSAGASSLPPLSTLKCCMCKDYLATPVTLPCLHTGCHSCFLKEAGPFSPIPEGSTKPLLPAHFHCPVCDEDATVPRNPSEISTDKRSTRLIELIQETRYLCDNCGELAEVECTTCNSSMCSGCFAVTHAAPVFKNHVAKPLKSAKLAQLSPCPEHGSEMEFWCDSCQKSVCQVCLLKGSHKGHKYTPIRDVRNSAYESIKLKMKAAGQFKAKMEACKSKVEVEMTTLNEQYDQVCNDININFEKIEEAMKLRKEALLEDARQLCANKETVLQQHRDNIALAVRSVSEAMENAWGIVKYSNDQEIVERQAMMEARLEKVASRSVAQEPEESGTMSVALFNHMGAAVAGYGAVRGTPMAAASAHKHQLEKLVNEADRILSNRTKNTAPDGSSAMAASAKDGLAAPENGADGPKAVVDDGSYCVIM